MYNFYSFCMEKKILRFHTQIYYFDYLISFEYAFGTLLVKYAFRNYSWFIQAFTETLLPPKSVFHRNTMC